MLTLEEISEFLARNPIVDLAVDEWRSDRTLRLHAHFEQASDFFSVVVGHVEYVDLIADFSLGGMAILPSGDAVQLREKWSRVAEYASGTGLVLWAAEASDVKSASDAESYLVIGEEVQLIEGKHFRRA